MYEAVVNTVPQAKFGLAFNESSGPCLTRAEGNDDELQFRRCGSRILRAVQDVETRLINTTMASAAMKLTWVTEAVAVLLLLTPLVCGQNPDELLVVRLPAKHGYINQPGATPIPFPTARDQTTTPGRARRCGSMAAGCALPRVASVVLETEKARGSTPKPRVANELKNPRAGASR